MPANERSPWSIGHHHSVFGMLFSLMPAWNMRKQLSKYDRMAVKARQILQAIVCASALWMLATSAAHADVWGFVDEWGVTHFAAEKIDDRYELFFRGGQDLDGKDAAKNPGVTAAVGEPTGKTAGAKPASKLVTYFEISPSFKAVKHHLREASDTNHIDIELLQALIAAESGFDPNAVSPKGAIGLMQLMPATAQRYGVQADPKKSVEQKLSDPRTNIRAGSRYLSYLIKLFPGKLELAIAAYNAGEGAVQRYGNQIPPYKETQNYVKTVMQMYTYLKPPIVVAAFKQLPSSAPNRVRVQMGGNAPAMGGAIGRGNMVTPLGSVATMPTPPSGSE